MAKTKKNRKNKSPATPFKIHEDQPPTDDVDQDMEDTATDEPNTTFEDIENILETMTNGESDDSGTSTPTETEPSDISSALTESSELSSPQIEDAQDVPSDVKEELPTAQVEEDEDLPVTAETETDISTDAADVLESTEQTEAAQHTEDKDASIEDIEATEESHEESNVSGDIREEPTSSACDGEAKALPTSQEEEPSSETVGEIETLEEENKVELAETAAPADTEEEKVETVPVQTPVDDLQAGEAIPVEGSEEVHNESVDHEGQDQIPAESATDAVDSEVTTSVEEPQISQDDSAKEVTEGALDDDPEGSSTESTAIETEVVEPASSDRPEDSLHSQLDDEAEPSIAAQDDEIVAEKTTKSIISETSEDVSKEAPDESSFELQSEAEATEISEIARSEYADESADEHDHRFAHDKHTEALIQAAARAVVASLEKERHLREHDDHEHDDAPEGSVVSSRDDGYDAGAEDSVVSRRNDFLEEENTELTYGDGTELTYDGETDHTYHSEDDHESRSFKKSLDEPCLMDTEDEHGGSSSSHHDAEIDDDDVFSDHHPSHRTSLDSCGTVEVHKQADQLSVMEDMAQDDDDDIISRMPSHHSFRSSPSKTGSQYTPTNRGHSRPPFRTPSSIRALQMSSPTPSLFASPRSSKHAKPTVSRLGTPNSHLQSPSSGRNSRTPTRFIKKELPLVLLHVTVLPVQWVWGDVLDAAEALPASLLGLRESWRLLLEKVGDTVMERGILLPHPQDDFEVLEERLLAALELPVRPRAIILRCGHYLRGSTPDPFSSSSESESNDDDSGFGSRTQSPRKRKMEWCDICGREVKLESADYILGRNERRFNVKVYASNGLMSEGAWSAAWKEMERVDVEIEPLVKTSQISFLEDLAEEQRRQQLEVEAYEESGQVQEDGLPMDNEHDHVAETVRSPEPDSELQLQQDETRQRAIDTQPSPGRESAAQEDDATTIKRMLEEERMREIYGADHPKVRAMTPSPQAPSPSPAPRDEHISPRTSSRQSTTSQRRAYDDESFLELLLKAFKVLMRDRKNVAIALLSVVVVLLAIRPLQNGQMSSTSTTDMGMGGVRTVEAIPDATPVIPTSPKVEEIVEDIPTAPAGALPSNAGSHTKNSASKGQRQKNQPQQQQRAQQRSPGKAPVAAPRQAQSSPQMKKKPQVQAQTQTKSPRKMNPKQKKVASKPEPALYEEVEEYLHDESGSDDRMQDGYIDPCAQQVRDTEEQIEAVAWEEEQLDEDEEVVKPQTPIKAPYSADYFAHIEEESEEAEYEDEIEYEGDGDVAYEAEYEYPSVAVSEL